MTLKDLKNAILSDDMDAVKQVYESLTGDVIEVEAPKRRGRPKKQQFPTPIVPDETMDHLIKVGKKVGFSIKDDKIERGMKPKFVENLFEDNGSGKREVMSEEDEELLKTLNASRKNRGNPFTHVKCSKCGVEEDVPHILAKNRKYQCNRCLTGD